MKTQLRIDLNYKVTSTVAFAILFAASLFSFSYLKHDDTSALWTTNIICVSASILGWLIGIITTPYDKQDEGKIGKFSSMIGTFISGYLLSKVDGIIMKIMDPETFFSSLTGLRFILFFSFFILTWIVVFVFRNYTAVDVAQQMQIIPKNEVTELKPNEQQTDSTKV